MEIDRLKLMTISEPMSNFDTISEPMSNFDTKIQAYILQSPEQTKDLKSTIKAWQYCENPETIAMASINDVVFVDDNDHEKIQLKLLNRCDLDPIILKYRQIFNLFTSGTNHNYHSKNIYIETKPAIALYQGRSNLDENIKIFAEYIKELGYAFDYSDTFNYPFENHLRDELNIVGLYIRPIRKTLEYNSEFAKRQYDVRHSKKKKPREQFITRDDLRDLQSELWQVFGRNLNLTIKYRDGYNTSYTKFGLCQSIMVLLDFHDLFFQKSSYRNLGSYKQFMKIWKTTPEKKREVCPKEFYEWINIEEKIKPRPNKPNSYYTIKEPKTKIFKISKLKGIR